MAILRSLLRSSRPSSRPGFVSSGSSVAQPIVPPGNQVTGLPGPRLRVLVVTSTECGDHVLVRRGLREGGVRHVVERLSPLEPMERLAEARPDVLVVSVDGENDRRLFERLREAMPHVPRVVVCQAAEGSGGACVLDGAGADVVFREALRHRTLGHAELVRAIRSARERARLTEAQRIAGVASWEWDRRTRTLRCSPELLELFGLSADVSSLGWRDVLERVHPADRDALRRAAAAAEAEPVGFRSEFRIVRPDGSIRHVRSWTARGASADGIVVGVNLDVTERRPIERTIEDHELFRRIYETEVVPVSIHELVSGAFVAVNDVWVAEIGYAREEVIGRRPADLGLWVDPSVLDSMMHELRERGRVHDVELNLRTRAGAVKICRIWLVLTELRGRAHVVSFLRDVTAERAAEARLRESEERLRQLFEDTRSAIFFADARGRMYEANPAAARLLGFDSPAEMRDQDLLRFLDRPEETRTLRRALLRGETVQDEPLRLRRRDGSIAEVMFTGYPRRGDDGQLQIVRIVLRDVTDERQLRRQFLQAQKLEAVARLAAGVAHDFNNLLTVIQMATFFARKEAEGAAGMLEHLEEIEQASHRGATLVRQLLAFGRRDEPAPRVLSLDHLIVDLERLLRRVIGEDLDLVVSAHSAPERVRLDPGHVEQVLMNLSVNARDAMPSGGSLGIETRAVDLDDRSARDLSLPAPGRYVRLSVSDTGTGMSEEVRARLFEPFFTTKELGKGTGLGLSTVREIVESAGGAIDVRSAPGAGATFEVYLPCAEGAQAVEPVGEEALWAEPGGSESVLLVEDDADLRGRLRAVLEARGYSVTEAPNGREALALARAGPPPDLVIADVIMPQLGGPETVERLRRRIGDLPALLLSGYDEGSRLEGAGGVGFLRKPFSPEQLLRTVRSVLEQKRAPN